MHYRNLITRALLGSFASFFVFTAVFYAFSAFALSDLSESLNSNTNAPTEDASSDEAAPRSLPENEEVGNLSLEDVAPASETTTEQSSSFHVLLDASGSMSESFNGGTKMDAVKAALEQGVNRIAGKNPVHVYAAGSVESSQDREAACSDVVDVTAELEGNPASSDIISAVNAVSPRGNAPIAFGLEEVSGKLSSSSEDVVLLIVDGADNCDGDILKAADDLLTVAPSTSIYTIGLNVESELGLELQQISEESSGQYFPVSDSEGLTAAVLAATSKLSTAQKTSRTSTAPTAVQGGESFEKARIFTEDDFGKTFTLKDHLDADTFEFWKLSLAPGQGAQITATTGAQDVSFTEGDAQENEDAPSAGVTIFDESESKIFDVSIQQEKEAETVGNIFSVSADKEVHTFFLGVGYALPVHKDMTYTIELVEEYDEVALQSDAPNDIDEQLPSLKEGIQNGYLSKSDLEDYYSLSIGNGQSVSVELTPLESDSRASLFFYDEQGSIIDSAEGSGDGEPVSIQYDSTAKQEITVGVLDVVGGYALDVNIEGNAIEEDTGLDPVIGSNADDLIDVEKAESSSALSDTVIRWIIIIGVALGIFIVMLIIAYLIISSRKKKTQKMSGPNKPTTPMPGKDVDPRVSQSQNQDSKNNNTQL